MGEGYHILGLMPGKFTHFYQQEKSAKYFKEKKIFENSTRIGSKKQLIDSCHLNKLLDVPVIKHTMKIRSGSCLLSEQFGIETVTRYIETQF